VKVLSRFLLVYQPAVTLAQQRTYQLTYCHTNTATQLKAHLGFVKVLSQFLPVCGLPSYLHSVSCSYVSCTHS
jgi:hypothetical protein